MRLAVLLLLAGVVQAQDWEAKLKEGTDQYHRSAFEQALATIQEGVRLAEEAHAGPGDLAKLELAHAGILQQLGRVNDAEEHVRRAVELKSSVVGALDLDLARLRMQLGTIEEQNDKLEEAELDLCTALETIGEDSPVDAAECLMRLAGVAAQRRAYGLARRLTALAREKLGEERGQAGWLLLSSIQWHAGWHQLYCGEMHKAEEPLRWAREAYSRLRVPRSPDALEATDLLIVLLTRQKRLDDAEELAQKTLKSLGQGNDHPVVATLEIRLAEIDLARGDSKGAAGHLERGAAAFAPEHEASALALETRARLGLRNGDIDGARVDAKQALADRTKEGEHGIFTPRTLLLLSEIESVAGARAEATRYAERAARIRLRELGARNSETQIALDEYRTLCARAVEAGVAEAGIPALKGERLNEDVEPDAAETDAKVRQLGSRAIELRSQKDLKAALALLDEALALRPGEPVTHEARAEVLGDLGRKDEAVAATDAAIRWSAEPTSRPYWNRAYLRLLLHHYDRAIVDATYALLLGEDDPSLHHIRGMSRLARAEEELALRNLDVVLKAHPDDQVTQYLRGVALWSLERFDEAAGAFHMVTGGSRRSNACGKLAQYERRRGNDDEALALATESIDKGAQDLAAYGVRGFVRLDRGEWKAALADFEAWAGDEAPSLYLRILQWLCRARLGERVAAAEALRAAIDDEKEREDLRAVARVILGEGPVPPTDAPVPEGRWDRGRQCEAHFLLGAWREAEGDPAGAKAHYERAVAMDRTDFLEHRSAKAALTRLGGGK